MTNCAHDPSKMLYKEKFIVDPANQEVDMADGKPIPVVSKSDITVRIKFNRYEYISASHLMIFDVNITNQNAKKITVKPTQFLFMGKKLPDTEGIVHTATGIAIDPIVRIQDLEQLTKAASTPSLFDTLEVNDSEARKKNKMESLKKLGN